jgi:cytochrome c
MWPLPDTCQPQPLQLRSLCEFNSIQEEMMKRILFALLAAASVTAPALADQALATSKNCMACHAIDKKLVGPAYKDVAAKYKGDKAAADVLAAKVMKGGGGVWGPVPMPANPQVSEAEAKKLVAWVLSQK